MYKDSVFVTLTYSDEHLANTNNPGQLRKNDLKNYLQRLKRKLKTYDPDKTELRHFAVGEYGDTTWRPHLHLILFGLSKIKHGKIIDQAWTIRGKRIGYTDLIEVNYNVAGYICKYVIKSMTRAGDPRLGKLKEFPEFQSCSKQGGGIGLPRIKQIGEQLKRNPHYKPRIITSLQHGKKILPLGRYLTQKLNEYQGINQEVIDENLYLYQQGIYDSHVDVGKWFVDSVLDEEKVRKSQILARLRIFQKKGKI